MNLVTEVTNRWRVALVQIPPPERGFYTKLDESDVQLDEIK